MASRLSSPSLDLIRAKTAAAHQALEATLEIARPGAGQDAYTRYLAALLGWLEPLERELWACAWPEPMAPAERAGKVRWVEFDLRARGMSDVHIAAIPRQRELPPLHSTAHRFGVAYVIEGAQLGGQLLLRKLGPQLAPLPTRWLEGYGHETSGKWRAFLAALTTSVADPRDAECAAASARSTFELAHAWFSHRGAA